jgi:ADP-dependent NAD(P)H-hydrate dehydratase / NAD(P)H-hydrate epimerase
MKVFTVAEMIAAEKAADAAGVTYDQMMETAGRRVAEAIGQRQAVAGKSVLILVGPGNNGGDGLVAGRYLAQAGADVAIYLFKARDPAADANLRQVQEMGLFILQADYDQQWRVLRQRLRVTDILVDALLGTGVTRPIEGRLARLLQQVKAGLTERSGGPVAQPELLSLSGLPATAGTTNHTPFIVAVDCPSGLNCDSGELDSLALQADLTVTFAGPKWGHFLFPGAAACGELVAAEIGIAATLPEVQAVLVTVATLPAIRALLPSRPLDGHKGSFGSAYIAAGSDHYRGAALLAGRAAYRVGAGLVAVVTPTAVRSVAAGYLPEATYPPAPEKQRLGVEAARLIGRQLDQVAALLIGPGLDQADQFLLTLLAELRDHSHTSPPLVVDADGLNILARQPDWPADLPPETILTPHPGEMARLMAASLAAVKVANRISLARQKARDWGHILLLKGAYTVIAAPDGRTTILPFANPALGAAGSGDVLAGAITGLLAQGMGRYEAAVVGGYLHGLAGSLAGRDAGLLAGELADLLVAARQVVVDPIAAH